MSTNEDVLKDYKEHDSKDYPAFVFCISDVIASYGQCPHLQFDEIPLREKWLKSTHDEGKVFFEIRDRILSKTALQEIESNLEMDRTTLDTFLRNTLDEHGYTTPSSYKNTETNTHPMDYIVESIRTYQQVKNRTNAARNEWKEVQKFIDEIFDHLGINFVKYLRLVHDMTFRYRHNEINTKNNVEYENHCDAYSKNQRALLSEENFIRKKQEEGYQTLQKIVANNFEFDQSGKYFKRWTLLTKDQQKERIQTYLDWYLRSYVHLSVQDREIQIAATITKIETALESGKLKNSSVKWVMKTGIITEIEGLGIDGQTLTFEVPSKVKVSKKKVSFADADEETSSSVTEKPKGTGGRSSNSRKKFVFSDQEERRLNKLLLYQLINLPELGRSRENIIHTVADSFTTHSATKQKAIAYLDSHLNKMVMDVQEAFDHLANANAEVASVS
jgi:hypothetical protein